MPREVIEEVKTVRRASQSEVEQMQELRVIAHRYQIPEEVIISHYYSRIFPVVLAQHCNYATLLAVVV